jgi:hypothetical protein
MKRKGYKDQDDYNREKLLGYLVPALIILAVYGLVQLVRWLIKGQGL